MCAFPLTAATHIHVSDNNGWARKRWTTRHCDATTAGGEAALVPDPLPPEPPLEL